MREVNKLHDASQNQLMLYIQKLLHQQNMMAKSEKENE